ncbi:MAG: ABC transporter permease [Clostridia bacterium]|nr:ABC transporter permease [Clostridia bacterium]
MKSKAPATPFALWMVIFTVVPLAVVLWFAFTDETGAFTMANLWAVGDFIPTFWESIRLGAIATVICLLLAYPLAYSISRTSARAQTVLVMLVMLPMWMNFLLRTYSWMSLLEDQGLINQFLQLIGLQPVHMINTDGAVVLGMVYNFLPYMVIPLYSVMMKIDSRLIEAAQDLGSNGFQVFRRVVLPLSKPGIVSGITMTFVPAVSTFAITKLLGDSRYMLIGDVIEMMFIGSSPNYNVGAMLSLLLMVLMLVSMTIMGFVDKNEDDLEGLMV